MATVDLFPDFRDFLESLNLAGVRYLVVGGYAVSYYGYKRTTDDIDVWIAIDPDNTVKLSKVLQTFGFPAAKVKPSMFQEAGKLFKFGLEPVRIDILTAPAGVDFESSYAARHEAVWDGVKVTVISFEDLKRNKRASGRAKDLADLENLPPTLDARLAKRASKRATRKRKSP